ncbi:TIGR01777 family oxidoreductase [bacterium]|nr:TIGR01777 family oxidoreductase [bacterium]
MGKRILIGGGSGLLGETLSDFFVKKEYCVTVLSRSESYKPKNKEIKKIIWDGKKIDTNEIFDVVINLSGLSIMDNRWSDKILKEIRDSRIDSTKAFCDFIEKTERKPECFISASAVGYYGEMNEKTLTEDSPKGKGWIPDLVSEWESEVFKSTIRVAALRFGIILSNKGGAFPKMVLSSKFGVVSHFGNHYFPWIHINDVIKVIQTIIENSEMSGVYNVVAPELVTQKGFIYSVAEILDLSIVLPVPTFALKLFLGERYKMLKEGQKVEPKRLKEINFEFEYPKLEGALRDLL